MTREKQAFFPTLYGLLFVAILSLISYLIVSTPWMKTTGLSSLVVAIIIGIIVGNSWHHPHAWSEGIQFSAKKLLRTAIILYGFRISFQQIASVGLIALLIDILMVTLTLIVGYFIGTKLFKLDRQMALLISAGSAICGAAAVLAAEDILKSEPYKATVAVATVVLFGTTSMFLYPLLQNANLFHFSPTQFGIFAGASIHEVAQALVAGTDINLEVGKIAVIVKMIRVLLLVPVLILLSILSNRFSDQKKSGKTKIIIPWFAIGFVLVIGFNSLHLLSTSSITLINELDTILLTMAMCAIGIETKLNKIKKVGLAPLYLAILLFGWLFTSAFVLVKTLT